jgi:hypothetical protein
MSIEQRKQLETEWTQCTAATMADGQNAFWDAMARAAEIEREIAASEKE